MKQTLKATAAVIGIVAAGLLLIHFIGRFMWLCYYAGIRM